MLNHPNEVAADRLRNRCDPSQFTFTTTADLPTPERMVGQERAAEALDFGLAVPESSYNIFVAGPQGSGRTISALAAAEAIAKSLPVPDDWCYVHNFAQPYLPRPLALPAGTARVFAQQVDTLVESLRLVLREAFDSELFRTHRTEALTGIDTERTNLQKELEEVVSERGFVLRVEEGEPNFLPAKANEDGSLEPLTRDDFTALSPEEVERLDVAYSALQEAYASARSRARALALRARAIERELNVATARDAVTPLIETLCSTYASNTNICTYLDQMKQDIIDSPSRLIDGDEANDAASNDGADAAAMMAAMSPSPTTRYRVNVLVDRTDQTHAPCILESNPTYFNIMGRLEYGQRMGNLFTDFSFIKAGALHHANGGILIIHLREMMYSPRTWEALKRSLRTKQITIENPADPQQSPSLAASLKPEPIPLTIKIILIAEPQGWDAMNELDPDFTWLFKVRADFSPEMARNPQTELYYAQFVGDVAREMQLPPLDRGAVASIIEEGARMTDDQTKLTSSLVSVRDIVIEAGYWARRSQSAIIRAEHIYQATQTRRRRMSLLPDYLAEQIRRNQVLVTTTGGVVGQINALAVIAPSGQPIGRVRRITVRSAPGQEGIVAVEREIDLSAPAHSKGIYTIAGYLAGKYGQDFPLTLSSIVSFEQNYVPVDGDSASMAELCGVVSSLANIPIRQDLAITGSFNQLGIVQAIGGATIKIEAFFDICVDRGLTGTQGVIIPASNVGDLMLRLDIISAVRDGAFHIYAIQQVEEAMELLMGRPAGRLVNGSYLQGTLNAQVVETLKLYAERVRHFRQPDR